MKRDNRSGLEAALAAIGAAIAGALGFVFLLFRFLRRGGRSRGTARGDKGGLSQVEEGAGGPPAGRRFTPVPQGQVSGPPPEPGYERRDWPYGRVVVAIVGLIALTAIAFVAVSLLQAGLTGQGPKLGPPPGIDETPQVTLPAPPVLQADRLDEIEQLRAAEDRALSSYGWVEVRSQIARIPITRAMELLAERGLPVAPQPSSGDAGRPSDANSGRRTETMP